MLEPGRRRWFSASGMTLTTWLVGSSGWALAFGGTSPPRKLFEGVLILFLEINDLCPADQLTHSLSSPLPFSLSSVPVRKHRGLPSFGLVQGKSVMSSWADEQAIPQGAE